MAQTETKNDIAEILLNEPTAAERKRPAYYWPFGVTLGVIIFDQITKTLVENGLGPIPAGYNISPNRIDLLGGQVQIVYLINRGASFGFLNDTSFGWIIFTTLAFLVSLAIIVWYVRSGTRDFWLRLGMGLVLGGILGNLLDRLFEGGGVRDIITIPNIPLFKVFNGADSGITVGVAIVLISVLARGFFSKPKPPVEVEKPAE